MSIKSSFVFLGLILLLASCSSHKSTTLSENQLFSIKYGSFENEILLYNINKVGDINDFVFIKSGGNHIFNKYGVNHHHFIRRFIKGDNIPFENFEQWFG